MLDQKQVFRTPARVEDRAKSRVDDDTPRWLASGLPTIQTLESQFGIGSIKLTGFNPVHETLPQFKFAIISAQSVASGGGSLPWDSTPATMIGFKQIEFVGYARSRSRSV